MPPQPVAFGAFVAFGLLLGGTACSTDGDPSKVPAEFLDPQQCAACHPDHFEQWQSSMHAYAADDPVFLAMNRRGQRETNGELGDFCIQCHAPVAVALGETADGLNLDQLPASRRGVTCYFCHQVDSVDGTHNNPLRLAFDRVFRGAIVDPVANDFHESTESTLHDQRVDFRASALCGACHDIVNPNGLHIERTYEEWQNTLYAAKDEGTGEPTAFAKSCGECHMERALVEGPVADFDGAPADRRAHSHLFAAVDVAVTPFPDPATAPQMQQLQRDAIDDTRDTVLCSSLCVQPVAQGAQVRVWLHNEAAGHSWPSGSSSDRRAWVELRAFDSGEFFSSGVVADGQSIDALDDPDLWLFRDRLFDEDGRPVHMFWEAASVQSNVLAAAESIGGVADDSVWVAHVYEFGAMPQRITSRVLLRPMAYEVLDDLIASGDLDPVHRDAFETFEIQSTAIEWDASTAVAVEGFGTCVSRSPACEAPVIRDVGRACADDGGCAVGLVCTQTGPLPCDDVEADCVCSAP